MTERQELVGVWFIRFSGAAAFILTLVGMQYAQVWSDWHTVRGFAGAGMLLLLSWAIPARQAMRRRLLAVGALLLAACVLVITAMQFLAP